MQCFITKIAIFIKSGCAVLKSGRAVLTARVRLTGLMGITMFFKDFYLNKTNKHLYYA